MKRTLYLTIHIAIALGLLLTGYSNMLSPLKWGVVSLLGYGLPLFILLTLASIMLALCTRKRYIVVPVAALLLCYGPVSLYCPVHVPSTDDAPSGSLRLMTYNTHSWGRGDGGDKETVPEMMAYVASQDADMVCLQEATLAGGDIAKPIDSLLAPVYAHREAVKLQKGGYLILLSRYPVKRHQVVADSGSGNGAVAFWVDVQGREVIVVNCHLLSTGLSIEQREKFQAIIQGEADSGRRQATRSIASRILQSTRERVPEADSIATFVRQHCAQGGAGAPVLVMGDFNDIPNSFVHYTLARHLTDCYDATGFGPGYSFSQYGMRVRIDNVFCSDHFTPHGFYVDSGYAGSDHYAVIGSVSL